MLEWSVKKLFGLIVVQNILLLEIITCTESRVVSILKIRYNEFCLEKILGIDYCFNTL